MAITTGIPDLNVAVAADLNKLATRLGLPAGVVSGILHGGSGIPTTRAKLTHAYSLRDDRNIRIGAVFTTDVRQARQIDLEYEVNVNKFGAPSEIVGQAMTTQTMTIARWDLYDTVMEEVFGDFELSMLTDQYRGFTLREVWQSPASILNSGTRRYQYGPIFFQDLGRNLGAEGNRTVRADATLVWLGRTKIQG